MEESNKKESGSKQAEKGGSEMKLRSRGRTTKNGVNEDGALEKYLAVGEQTINIRVRHSPTRKVEIKSTLVQSRDGEICAQEDTGQDQRQQEKENSMEAGDKRDLDMGAVCNRCEVLENKISKMNEELSVVCAKNGSLQKQIDELKDNNKDMFIKISETKIGSEKMESDLRKLEAELKKWHLGMAGRSAGSLGEKEKERMRPASPALRAEAAVFEYRRERESTRGGGSDGPAPTADEKQGSQLDEIFRSSKSRKPEKITEKEWFYEKEDRNERKRNMIIKGIRTVGKGTKKEIEDIIKEKLGIPIYINKIRASGGGMWLQLDSLKNKVQIFKGKRALEPLNIWLEDDLTEREMEVQHWLEAIAEEGRKKRLRIRVGYMKIEADGKWFYWNETKGDLEEQTEQRG